MKISIVMRGLLLTAVIALLPQGHGFAEQGWRIAAAEAWVEKLPLPDSAPEEASEPGGGVQYLLIDKQYRISDADTAMFFRCVGGIENQSGVNEFSQLSFTFDPSYQALTIHEITVHRDGTASSRLTPEDISLLRREQQLDYQIVDGRQTAHVVLDDIRIGDIVEYSYTISGSNPVFANHSFLSIYLQGPMPVNRMFVRVIWDESRPMHYRIFGESVDQPEVARRGRSSEYVWDIPNQPAVEWEESTPEWYRAYPELQISDIGTWEQLVEWALPLYEVTESASARCGAVVQSLLPGIEGNRQRADALLKYVQNEIRYTGLEIGPHTYAPNAPEIVLDRRFGDCKDKSLLLTALLREIGIEAYPALVSTLFRGHVQESLPSPLDFDHVIVVAVVDGKRYYLDPTLSHEQGVLDDTLARYYGKILLIKEGTAELELIEEPRIDKPIVAVRERFDASGGIEGPVHLRIETEFRTYRAGYLRAYLESTTPNQLQKDYINYLERLYPGLEAEKQLEFVDDTKRNRFTIVEHYRIPGMWRYDPEEGQYDLLVHPYQIYPYTEKPATLRRHMPLSLEYPLHEEHTIEVELFEPWFVEEDEVRIENPAFTFTSTVQALEEGKRIRISYNLKTQKDSVQPTEMRRYLKDLDRVDEELGYVFSYSDEIEAAPYALFDVDWKDLIGNWNFLIITAFTLAAASVAARRLYLYDPPLEEPPTVDLTLQGVSGWLALFAIRLYVYPVSLLITMAGSLSGYELSTWRAVISQSSTVVNVLWGFLLVFELMVNLTMIVFSVLLIVLFRKRRRTFPKLFITTGAIWAGVVGFDLLAAQLLLRRSPVTPDPVSPGVIGDIVVTVLWCFYIAYSARVKATFTEGLQPGPSTAHPSARSSTASA